MPTTVTSLEDRVDHIEDKLSEMKNDVHSIATDFSSFKSKMETMMAVMKWLGVFVAGLTVTTVFNIISVAHSAGKLESNVDRMSQSLLKQESAIEDLKKQTAAQAVAIAKLDGLISKNEHVLGEFTNGLKAVTQQSQDVGLKLNKLLLKFDKESNPPNN